MNYCMTLDLRIRELRQAKGWTLEDLSSRIGVSKPHLSEVERGVKNLNNHLIERISAELGVTPQELFANRSADRSAELRKIMDELDDTSLAKVLGYAQALAAEAREQN